MKKKDLKFKIGDWVWVRHKTVVDYHEPNAVDYSGPGGDPKTAVKVKVDVVGQVAGLKRKFIGKLVSPEYDPRLRDPQNPYLNVTEELILWEVKTGYLNKPILVAEEDMGMALHELGAKLPLLHTKRTPWTESEKHDLRQIMKDEPRDEKGRWV